VPSDLITSHHCAIQDKDEDFYLQFQIVICGLDSVEARRWINATLVNMVDWGDPQRTLKPLIDGGTEGNQSRFKVPSLTSFQDSVGKRV
jgi:ubiquitin-activating enzyme E1 C